MKVYPLLLLLLLALLCKKGIESRSIDGLGYSFVGRGGSTRELEKIDTSLYSRQLLVYGKSAQIRLLEGHIAIVGENSVTHEIVKNLALSGVGKITIFSFNKDSPGDLNQPHILANDENLIEYVKGLNNNVKVELESIASLNDDVLVKALQDATLSTVISANQDISSILVLNKLTRAEKKRLIAVRVMGNIAMIFNDLLDKFLIEDIDGETHKEIPLSDKAVIDSSTPSRWTISSIEEENLNLGLGDSIEIRSHESNSPHIIATVKEVKTLKSCIIELEDPSQGELLSSYISTKKAFIKKRKITSIVEHQPLHEQLLHPRFNPTNSCLSKKQDVALTFSLFAALKSLDLFLSSKKASKLSRESLRQMVIKELQLLGISDPECSLKAGGKIGKERLDDIIEKVSQWSDAADVACPAMVSIVGSIASQEAVKVLTSMYQPINQIMMFEHLDASSNDFIQSSSPDCKKKSNKKQGMSGSGNSIARFYGKDIADELKSLKVFVVGSGAIGCELLKNFALIGIGTASPTAEEGSTEMTDTKNEEEGNLWNKHHLNEGGILLTDMDLIEKSNLNRQLLFRPQHIGQPKSLVAAEQVKLINPNINIHPLLMKVTPDTESIFTESFWKTADIIITALDNVEARKYVDQQCVKYKCWLIDSGTLGTKANTQVVIPYLTESYSSSSDPPEDSIPLCTLKSFPYQPDHCIAWSKQLFLQLFQQNIQLYQKYTDTLHPLFAADASPSEEEVVAIYSTNFNEEDQFYLQLASSFLYHTSTKEEEKSSITSESKESAQKAAKKKKEKNKGKNAKKVGKKSKKERNHELTEEESVLDGFIYYAMKLLEQFFDEEIKKLIKEHPLDSLDEEEQPFWGGSRRFPQSISLDLTDHQQQLFVSSAVSLLQQQWLMITTSEPYSIQNINMAQQEIEEYLKEHSSRLISSYKRKNKAIEKRKKKIMTKEDYIHLLDVTEKLKDLNQIDFDKDNVSLGHVDFVIHAANLRAKNYHLRQVDRLETQKIAGNIIPALATTTSFIAGQVTAEIIKFAAMRVSMKRNSGFNSKISKEKTKEAKTDEIRVVKEKTKEKKKKERKEKDKKDKKKEGKKSKISQLFGKKEKKPYKVVEHEKKGSDESNGNSLPFDGNEQKTVHRSINDEKKEFYLQHKTLLLKKFRNSFINLADNGLSFVQPVEVSSQTIPYTNYTYTIWDDIILPDYYTIENMTLQNLLDYLQETLTIPVDKISSIEYDGHFIYHRDLIAAESIDEKEIEERDEDEDEAFPALKKTIRSAILDQCTADENADTDNIELEEKDVVRLRVHVMSEENELEDVMLPSVIVKVPKLFHSSSNTDKKERRWFRGFRSWFRR